MPPHKSLKKSQRTWLKAPTDNGRGGDAFAKPGAEGRNPLAGDGEWVVGDEEGR
jgi:hypothetical protein